MPLSMVLTAHLVQKQNNKILWSPCFRDTFTFPQGIQARRVIVQLLNSIFSFSKKHSLQSFSFMLNFGKRPGFRELFTFLHRLLEERLGAVSRLRCPDVPLSHIQLAVHLPSGWANGEEPPEQQNASPRRFQVCRQAFGMFSPKTTASLRLRWGHWKRKICCTEPRAAPENHQASLTGHCDPPGTVGSQAPSPA